MCFFKLELNQKYFKLAIDLWNIFQSSSTYLWMASVFWCKAVQHFWRVMSLNRNNFFLKKSRKRIEKLGKSSQFFVALMIGILMLALNENQWNKYHKRVNKRRHEWWGVWHWKVIQLFSISLAEDGNLDGSRTGVGQSVDRHWTGWAVSQQISIHLMMYWTLIWLNEWMPDRISQTVSAEDLLNQFNNVWMFEMRIR